MSTLSASRPGSNPGGSDPVRPDQGVFLSGEFTEAKFEAWLDQRPGRRKDHESQPLGRQAETRAHVARLFALRTSPMARDLARIADLADELSDHIADLLNDHAPMEARHMLELFGLAVPGEFDINQSWGGETFKHPRKECKRLKKALTRFSDRLVDHVTHLVPNDLTGRIEPAVADQAAERRAA